MATKNTNKSDNFVVLYFDTDGCTDPKIKTAPVDKETAKAKLKALWKANLARNGYEMPTADVDGSLYSEDAYLSANGMEATMKPYEDATYENKWLVVKIPTK